MRRKVACALVADGRGRTAAEVLEKVDGLIVEPRLS